jgi:DNA-binding MarR family transcriptional regulator
MRLELIPHIHRATHRIALHLERHPALGVSQAEAHILAHMADAGEATISELHRALAHRRSTLTSILDRLEARGLIGREVSPRDRRSIVVRLTRPGRVLARRVFASLQRLEAEVLQAVRKEDVSALIEALDSLGR